MSNQEVELWQKIKDKPYCDPAKRMDFVLFFDVRDGNPNGDPDAGNLPRMDPETLQGIVTDVCIKRKIRDYLADVLKRKIYIQSQAALNSLYFDAARSVKQEPIDGDDEAVAALLVELNAEENTEFKELIEQPQFKDWLVSVSPNVDGLEFNLECGTLSYLGEANNKEKFKRMFPEDDLELERWKKEIDTLARLLNAAKPKKNAQERRARNAVKRKMCELYDDIRLFGGVLTAGTNAGQIRGPIQLTFGRSINPILQMDAAITRCAITKSSDWLKKQTEFGRKPWLSWAVYRQHGFFNPLLGRSRQQDGTGITNEDLARFWEALACMFRNSDSASRGEMTMHDIIVFVHDNPRGNAPSHLLFKTVTCKNDERIDLNQEDLEITIVERDGFDKRYLIKVDKQTNGKIKVERPLRDIWTIS